MGQSPLCVDRYDNKDWVNTLLRKSGGFTMPRSWDMPAGSAPSADAFRGLPFPIVAKPIRGRGSHGVKVCRSPEELAAHGRSLADEDTAVMLEEFLQGEEATVTVMPPNAENGYWALPLVSRFNHHDGIAPYNGTVAVTANSRVVPDCDKDPICAQFVIIFLSRSISLFERSFTDEPTCQGDERVGASCRASRRDCSDPHRRETLQRLSRLELRRLRCEYEAGMLALRGLLRYAVMFLRLIQS